jgi:C1A family cysteine protease
MMATKGWLPDKTMPSKIKNRLDPVVSFSTVEKVFKSKASSAAQDGTDYDIPNQPAVYDQGDMGSCVLNSTCGAANIVLAVEGLSTTMLSRLFLYWQCRLQMGTTTQDSGTYTHLAVDRVGNIGVCEESIWPYADSNLTNSPTPDTYPEASDNKFTAWFNIDALAPDGGTDRLTQMETAIRSNHPVIYGSPVSSAIQNYQPGQILTIPDSSDIIGGHSTCFTGVHYVDGARVWVVRNSWGAAWGNSGYFLMDDAWAGWTELDDLWVMTRMDPLMF